MKDFEMAEGEMTDSDLLNRSSTKVINMKHQLFALPRFEGPSSQKLKELKKFDHIQVVEYGSEEIKELFKKWTDPDSKDLIYVEHCEMTPELIATLEHVMAEKSCNITLWIVTKYFHDLERVCDNVATVSISHLPNKKEKNIIFDKFGEEMTKEEIQTEMEKLKMPSFVATFCRHIEQKQH